VHFLQRVACRDQDALVCLQRQLPLPLEALGEPRRESLAALGELLGIVMK
jgi:hypothetical protein